MRERRERVKGRNRKVVKRVKEGKGFHKILC